MKIKIDIQEYNGRFNIFVAGAQSDHIKGCPMGRGNNRDEAINDLINRISIESHIDVEIERIIE